MAKFVPARLAVDYVNRYCLTGVSYIWNLDTSRGIVQVSMIGLSCAEDVKRKVILPKVAIRIPNVCYADQHRTASSRCPALSKAIFTDTTVLAMTTAQSNI